MLVISDCLVMLYVPVPVSYNSNDCCTKGGKQSVRVPRTQKTMPELALFFWTPLAAVLGRHHLCGLRIFTSHCSTSNTNAIALSAAFADVHAWLAKFYGRPSLPKPAGEGLLHFLLAPSHNHDTTRTSKCMTFWPSRQFRMRYCRQNAR